MSRKKDGLGEKWKRIVFLIVFLSTGIAFQMQPSDDAGNNQEPVSPFHALEVKDVVVHNNFSEQVGVDAVLEGMRGQSGIGLFRAEHRGLPRLERPQNREFNLESGQPFTPYLLLSNNTDQPQTHLISAIVDYQQKPFALDGKEGVLHEITVPVRKELEIPVSLPISGEGMHDVLFLQISDPYNKTLDVDQRMNTFNDTFGTRAVIFVGEMATPAHTLNYVTEGTLIPEGITYNPPVHFAEITSQAQKHPSERQLYVAQAPPGATYSFQTRVANEGEKPVNYTFIPFLNYRQVSVDQKQVLPVRLEPNTELIINVDLPVPEKEGIYLFELVYVYDSYHSLLEEDVLSPFIRSSERLAIEVAGSS